MNLLKKEEVRRRVRAHKALLNSAERIEAADRVFRALERTAAFIMSEHILMYHSLPDELPTHRFLERWHGIKHFYLPRVIGPNLEILPYDPQALVTGAFGIEEPQGTNVVPISAMELIVVPGMGFDRRGQRVGRGRGFYDRLLADTNATRIGIAYDFQLFDKIETEPHDEAVDVVITERYYCHAASGRKLSL